MCGHLVRNILIEHENAGLCGYALYGFVLVFDSISKERNWKMGNRGEMRNTLFQMGIQRWLALGAWHE
jgi:hypothetical protein